ncbi:hypothetical protein JCM19233_4866 [Vibrio astriarenae]|nr:hypothetical protein JCM19233_4866 [Vibrio sp. C7]
MFLSALAMAHTLLSSHLQSMVFTTFGSNAQPQNNVRQKPTTHVEN